MSIPLALLSKMGNYEVKLGDTQLKVNLITHPAVLDEKLAEFQKTLLERRVVEHDSQGGDCTIRNLPWVMLCSRSRCLAIDLRRVKPVPKSLINFMRDTSIIFVGTSTSSWNHRSIPEMKSRDVVTLDELAAVVRKKPKLEGSSLKVLVAEVGFDATEMTARPKPFDWSAKVFSEEDMKFVVCDAYYCYAVANKLLAML